MRIGRRDYYVISEETEETIAGPFFTEEEATLNQPEDSYIQEYDAGET